MRTTIPFCVLPCAGSKRKKNKAILSLKVVQSQTVPVVLSGRICIALVRGSVSSQRNWWSIVNAEFPPVDNQVFHCKLQKVPGSLNMQWPRDQTPFLHMGVKVSWKQKVSWQKSRFSNGWSWWVLGSLSFVWFSGESVWVVTVSGLSGGLVGAVVVMVALVTCCRWVSTSKITPNETLLSETMEALLFYLYVIFCFL